MVRYLFAIISILGPAAAWMVTAEAAHAENLPDSSESLSQANDQQSSKEPGALLQSAGYSPASLLEITGNFESYLAGISYGQEDDGEWSQPSSNLQTSFAAALSALLAGDIATAIQAANSIGFQLIRYTDPQRGQFYVLRDPPNARGISPGGIYVVNSSPRFNSIIEVPHPKIDGDTEFQGIELFLASDSTMLLIGGTHRKSDRLRSVCENASKEDFRRSDGSHAVSHLFHIAHTQAEDMLDEPLFIQLHGFDDKAYKKLKKECRHNPSGSDPKLLVNVSDTYLSSRSGSGAPLPGSFARLLSETINDEGTIKACLFNEDTKTYGGTLNVQARYTNGSSNPCQSAATNNNGRFIHLEQSINVRSYQRTRLTTLIKNALETYFE